MYLDYNEFAVYGGVVEETQYPLYEQLARKKLDNWTQNKIKTATQDVKLAMFIIIKSLIKNYIADDEQNITSFSNDGISVTYEQKKQGEIELELYQQVVEILPIELISAVI